MSKDDGKTWSKSVVIEKDPDGWYCYTSMTFQKDLVLLTYNCCVSPTWCMSRLKVASLAKTWFEKTFYSGSSAKE